MMQIVMKIKIKSMVFLNNTDQTKTELYQPIRINIYNLKYIFILLNLKLCL